MAKNLILVNTNPDILKYDNRKAIELAQTLGRPLTGSEYETLKIKSFTPKRLTPRHKGREDHKEEGKGCCSQS
jgi:hypothetical protein